MTRRERSDPNGEAGFQALLEAAGGGFNPRPNRYLERHALFPPAIGAPPHSDLGLIVTIPCNAEPDLLAVLDDLWRAATPRAAMEAIVVVNGSSASPEPVKAQNRASVDAFNHWIVDHWDRRRAFHLIDRSDLPAKDAGVGLARKIAMDEAVARFHAVGALRGVIVCLDADCRVNANYLTAIEDFFTGAPDLAAATLHFEHPLEGLEPRHRRAIAGYELHMRLHRRRLAATGFPHPLMAMGSAMAVRSEIYQAVGGMNRRKAGEDFYFLHKIPAVGEVGELAATTVRPSPRVSDRVPFGTGRAVGDWLATEQEAFSTFDPRVYRDLQALFDALPALYLGKPGDGEGRVGGVFRVDEPMAGFLAGLGADRRVVEIRDNTASEAAFRKRFFQWFNGLKAQQFINQATASHYPRISVEVGAHRYLQETGRTAGNGPTGGNDRTPDAKEGPEPFLALLRGWDRQGD